MENRNKFKFNWRLTDLNDLNKLAPRCTPKEGFDLKPKKKTSKYKIFIFILFTNPINNSIQNMKIYVQWLKCYSKWPKNK